MGGKFFNSLLTSFTTPGFFIFPQAIPQVLTIKGLLLGSLVAYFHLREKHSTCNRLLNPLSSSPFAMQIFSNSSTSVRNVMVYSALDSLLHTADFNNWFYQFFKIHSLHHRPSCCLCYFKMNRHTSESFSSSSVISSLLTNTKPIKLYQVFLAERSSCQLLYFLKIFSCCW